jgi:predicted transposase YbfD/YdcC
MPSSPTAPAVRIPDTPAPNPRLADHLARVPDPRKPRGKRYPLTGLLLLAISATLAGCRGFTAIGEWAAILAEGTLAGFGLRAAPGESNLRKLFSRLDAGALDAELCLYAWTRTTTIDGRRVIAVDGKTPARLPIADPHRPGIWSQPSTMPAAPWSPSRAVDAKSNEIPALPDLIAALGERVRGAVITADALHTQTATATAILAAGADYVFTVKANQPGLHKRLKSLPWSRVPAGHVEVEKSHGRRVRRTLKVVQAPADLGFEGGGAGRSVAPGGHPEGEEDHGGGVSGHLGRSAGGAAGPDRGVGARSLGCGEPVALGQRCDLRRGQAPGQDWFGAAGDGHPEERGDRHSPDEG